MARMFRRNSDSSRSSSSSINESYRAIVKSYGIIVIKSAGTSDPAILCIQSRHTYFNACLIAGRRWYSSADITQDFADGMTKQERSSLLNDSHANGYPYFLTRFLACHASKLNQLDDYDKKRFIADAKRSFHDFMTRMRTRLLNSKIDGPLPWSVPKGRGNKNKPTSLTAEMQIGIRELEEETGVTINMIDFCTNIPPFIVDYIDMGIRYIFKLYYAVAKDNIKYNLDPKNIKQLDEISNIAWLTKKNLQQMSLCRITKSHLLGNFDNIISHMCSHQTAQDT